MELVSLIAAEATTQAGSSQSPYSGTPASIPGKVEIENYDLGGEGTAYHDTTSGNAGSQYELPKMPILNQPQTRAVDIIWAGHKPANGWNIL